MCEDQDSTVFLYFERGILRQLSLRFQMHREATTTCDVSESNQAAYDRSKREDPVLPLFCLF